MKVLAIFLVAMVFSTHAMSLFEKYPMNYSSKRSIMTVLTQVESKLKTGGPLDAITKMLDEFVTAVTEEQVQHDELFEKQNAECEDEFSFRKKEVADAVAAMREAQETLDGCQAQHVRATGDLAITKKQLSENRAFLATIEATRRREAYNFETKATAFTMLTQAIEDALVILQEIWDGQATFLQIARHTNNMLLDSVKLRKAHMMAPIMSALAQLAQADIQADEGLLEKVRDLFIKYKEDMGIKFAEAAEAEQKAEEEYAETKARLEATIEHLAQQEIDLAIEIEALDKCIVMQTGIVQAATAKRDRNQELLDAATEMCASFNAEYEAATAARKEELELLALIRERVEFHFAHLAEGVVERGKMDKEDFEYDNAYAYEQPKFEHEE